jgi:hypothetical protein
MLRVCVALFDRMLTDASAKAVAKYAKNLTDWDIRGTLDITVEGVRHVAKGCPKLVRVRVGTVRFLCRVVALLWRTGVL